MTARVFLLLAALSLAGCSSLYYGAMEKIGKEKRDILIQRIAAGKKDQQEAREQLKTTLEVFQELAGVESGKLDKAYKKLNQEFERSEQRAKDLRERVESIDRVGKDLFSEWEQELAAMKDRNLKSRSQQMLRDTRQRHQQYVRRMQQTVRKMEPVLGSFRDQVLFLKHNLNAQAVGSLQTTAAKLDGEVGALVKDIEASMIAADEFIASLTVQAS